MNDLYHFLSGGLLTNMFLFIIYCSMPSVPSLREIKHALEQLYIEHNWRDVPRYLNDLLHK